MPNERAFDTFATASAPRLWQQLTNPRLTPLGPVGEGALELFRQMNIALDASFYDVGVVPPADVDRLAADLVAEGAILVVEPGNGSITLYRSIDEYVGAAPDVHALTVAGVGSSGLGAAALARNVADAIKAPVATVISGKGVSDVVTEALGGWFLFRTLNGWRHSLEWLDRLRERGTVKDPAKSTTPTAARDLPTAFAGKDVRQTLALLSHPDLRFDLLVGHSKGNLVISEALFELQAWDHAALDTLGQRAYIVTLGARINMPDACTHVVDVMGELDFFGMLNSRGNLDTEYSVPGTWHHTAPNALFDKFGKPLLVKDVFAHLRAQGLLPPGP